MARFDTTVIQLNDACLMEFADLVVYTPLGGVAFNLPCIQTEKATLMADPFPSQYVVFWAKMIDFPLNQVPSKGDTFAVGVKFYTVVSLKFEDVGGGFYFASDLVV